MGTQPPPEWVLHARYDRERALELGRALDAPTAFAHVLVNRGMPDPESARHFLAPSLDDLHDPLLLLDLDAALDRLVVALREGQPIFIQGDYDVDGITSTFVLYSTLLALGATVTTNIPHRTRDGYGLSVAAVDEAHRRGSRLIVTVDCGITANEPVAHARALGIDTIVTDHHEPGPLLPEAVAVVNPHRDGCPYPFKSLAGVGVTYKLVEALGRRMGSPAAAIEFLDVVALGTIADVVPLVGENRILAYHGLARLQRTTRLGLRALLDRAGLSGRAVSSGQVAFGLAPRINAAGRMGNAEQALRLLLARDEGEARDCAESLEEDNDRRRTFDEAAATEATERVESELGWPACAGIVLWSDAWHPGVLGIVASRLVERFQRPSLMIALDGERGRGSGRSVPGLDLTEVLGRCGDLLEAYGGHALAAGFTVRRDNLIALRERFETLVRERTADRDPVQRLSVDADATIAECDLGLIAWLERLAPHGLGNPEPVFRVDEAVVESASAVGAGKHLRLTVRDATGRAEAIGFGLGGLLPSLRPGTRCALAFVPTRNEWNGRTRVQLKLKGAKPR